MTDSDHIVEIAYLFNRLREPVLHSAIQTLQFPSGSQGLDIGCSVGLQTIQSAETVGPAGHITGLDLSPDILVYAKDIVKKAGLSERISFRQGDMKKIPFDDDSFNWIWSMDCAGYAPIEPLPIMKELARVVKPGGSVAILAWSSERILPGYPLLEARLSATPAGIAPFVDGKKPGAHFPRALGWFHDAGLV